MSVVSGSAGADYVKERLQLIILAGENELVVEIDVLDDSVVEGDEYFSVYLTTEDVSLTVTTPTANVTILEDDSKGPLLKEFTHSLSISQLSR